MEKDWLVSQYPWKEKCNNFKNRKYKFKKVDKYILSLKHRGWKNVWTRYRKQGVKMSHMFLADATNRYCFTETDKIGERLVEWKARIFKK